MFAGDNFKPAADASYRNFDAGPSFHVGSNVRYNHTIGTIDSWGPFFRVSLDLMIHSYSTKRWSSVLNFNWNGTQGNKFGDRIPSIFINNDDRALVIMHWNRLERPKFYFKINLKTWYNVLIEQKGRKVRS